jgi:uncharacterized membrane protein YedE/YeeE
MEQLSVWLSGPWPWYVAGPIIGSMVPLMLLIGSKSFGVSQNLEHICAMTQPKRVNVSFFQYDWKQYGWCISFVVGVAIGGFLAVDVFQHPGPIELSSATQEMLAEWGIKQGNGFYPSELYDLTPINILILAASGILIGFGTRYASGCTSGHAITGLATLQMKSLKAVIGIFAGGIIAAYLITPILIAGVTP